MKTEIKIGDLLNHLTSLLSVLKGKKVQMGSGELKKGTIDFHDNISELINTYLKSFGLIYSIWNIEKINKDYREEYFTITIPNFVNDKRVTSGGRVGVVIDLCIKPIHDFPNVMDITLEEYYHSIKIKHANESVTHIKAAIKNQEEELKKTKLELEKSEQDLEALLKEHKVN